MILGVACFLSVAPILQGQSVVVIRTASTNTPERRVPAGTQGRFDTRTQQRLWAAIQHAQPLSSLPVAHCMRSASFGTQLFVEVNGVRSPDLSCPHQTDRRAAALQTEALEVLAASPDTKRKR